MGEGAVKGCAVSAGGGLFDEGRKESSGSDWGSFD